VEAQRSTVESAMLKEGPLSLEVFSCKRFDFAELEKDALSTDGNVRHWPCPQSDKRALEEVIQYRGASSMSFGDQGQ